MLEAELASTTTDREDLICMLGEMRDEKDASTREMKELVRENASLKRAMHRYDGADDAREDVYLASMRSHDETLAELGSEAAADETREDCTTPSSSMRVEPQMDTSVHMDAILEVETQLARFKKLKAEQEEQILRLRALQDKTTVADDDEDGTEEKHLLGVDVGSNQDALKDMLMEMQRTPNRR